MGDVIGDLNSRRGQIRAWTCAAMPQVDHRHGAARQMFGYVNTLRS